MTVDSVKHALPSPFFVIATQNPVHQSGTYPLPESQLDRFFMRISLGFPDKHAEKNLILGLNNRNYDDLPVRINPGQLAVIQKEINTVTISNAVVDYILELVAFTRQDNHFVNPLSPRASIALSSAAKSWAYIEGRDFVLPEDVQAVFPSVTDHRLGLNAGDSGFALKHVPVSL